MDDPRSQLGLWSRKQVALKARYGGTCAEVVAFGERDSGGV